MLIFNVSVSTDPDTLTINDAAKMANRFRSQIEQDISKDLIDHTFLHSSKDSRGIKCVVKNNKWKSYLRKLKSKDRAKVK